MKKAVVCVVMCGALVLPLAQAEASLWDCLGALTKKTYAALAPGKTIKSEAGPYFATQLIIQTDPGKAPSRDRMPLAGDTFWFGTDHGRSGRSRLEIKLEDSSGNVLLEKTYRNVRPGTERFVNMGASSSGEYVSLHERVGGERALTIFRVEKSADGKSRLKRLSVHGKRTWLKPRAPNIDRVSWSPDGKSLVFVELGYDGTAGPFPLRVYHFDATTGSLGLVRSDASPFASASAHIFWSADSRAFGFFDELGVVFRSFDTATRRQLAEIQVGRPGVNNSGIAMSVKSLLGDGTLSLK